ncbi:MAG: spondin domain-containing protein [Gammaproteobacteria bacterium]
MNHHVFAESNGQRLGKQPRAKRSAMSCFGVFPGNGRLLVGLLAILGTFGLQGTAQAKNSEDDHHRPSTFRFEVTITNVTRGEFASESDICRTGQIMGLFAFATHRPSLQLFELGQPVRATLATLAETGAPFLLAEELAADPRVGQAFSLPSLAGFPGNFFDGVLCAGQTLTTRIGARPGDVLSLAAMTFPTNDGFIGLSGVRLPVNGRKVTYFSQAYDAGSESNDELCIHMPGITGLPGCPGAADGEDDDLNSDPNIPDENPTGGEGYIHIHSGIHGVGDLAAKDFDWRNPVARITIQRVR